MGLKILYITFIAANLPITGVEGHYPAYPATCTSWKGDVSSCLACVPGQVFDPVRIS